MSSYTSRVKNEIFSKNPVTNLEKLAELSAIFNVKNAVFEDYISIKIENLSLAKRVYATLKNISDLKIGIKYSISNQLGEHNVFTIQVFKQNYIKTFISSLHFSFMDIIQNEEILRGYVRGIFLVCGYSKNPKKEYALDFFIDNKLIAEQFYQILYSLKKKVFKTKKRNKTLVYLRNSEDIMDIFVIMNAMQSFFEYEEVTMIKEIKNKTIREMNWEVANETKVLNAGNYQLKMINYIADKIGTDNLTPVLEEAALLRLNNPESSLQELADMIGISKSGIRNRFRRIEEIYNNLIEDNSN